MITVQHFKPINFLLPQVYRYMDEKFIDLFFNEGILRISSFERLQKFPDEVRGDPNEGTGTIISRTKEGMQIVGVTESGNNAYMLCTSTLNSKNIMRQFNYNSYFIIKEPLDFSIAISNALPGFIQGFQGFCKYQNFRLVNKEIPQMENSDFTDENGHIIIGGPKMMQRLGEMVGNGTDLMFLKEDKYQSQCEYRFIWQVNNNFYPTQDYLDIKCREAIQFCERVDDIEMDGA